MKIFDTTIDVLERMLDLRGMRHRVIAANIANEETPGYRAKDLRFPDALSAAVRAQPHIAVQATHARHLGTPESFPQVKGRVVELPTPDLPLDANSVNLDFEMAKLSDNAMHYNTAATVISLRFRQLLAAIRDAR
ncbi:MAG: flagellar basal body rod protein FlgB [Nitrospiraceae bacterium]